MRPVIILCAVLLTIASGVRSQTPVRTKEDSQSPTRTRAGPRSPKSTGTRASAGVRSQGSKFFSLLRRVDSINTRFIAGGAHQTSSSSTRFFPSRRVGSGNRDARLRESRFIIVGSGVRPGSPNVRNLPAGIKILRNGVRTTGHRSGTQTRVIHGRRTIIKNRLGPNNQVLPPIQAPAVFFPTPAPSVQTPVPTSAPSAQPVPSPAPATSFQFPSPDPTPFSTPPPVRPPTTTTTPPAVLQNDGCPAGQTRTTCPTDVSERCQNDTCYAYPDARCRLDSCNNCQPTYFVQGINVCCDRCRNGYLPVIGRNPCETPGLCGQGEYCSPIYCVQPLFNTAQFECRRGCEGESRGQECMFPLCGPGACPGNCIRDFCTCQSRCEAPETTPPPSFVPSASPPVSPAPSATPPFNPAPSPQVVPPVNPPVNPAPPPQVIPPVNPPVHRTPPPNFPSPDVNPSPAPQVFPPVNPPVMMPYRNHRGPNS